MSKASSKVEKTPGNVFVSLALDMSWRLALVVLVPIIGGYELDRHFNISPTLTVIGFVVAMVGMGLVMWQTLQTANQMPVPKLTAAQKRAIKRQDAEDED